MTLPSGTISMSEVNVELSLPATTLITLNDADVRDIAGAPFITPGTTISMNDLRGKSAFTAITATATGTVTPVISGNYQLFIFTGPGSFNVSDAGSEGLVDYLVVAGGGGGGGRGPGASTPNGPNGCSAGGGAGGLRTGSLTITATNYPITRGGGGAVGPFPSTTDGSNGGNSVFHTITSSGGGGGAGAVSPTGTSNTGQPGGSGGGGVGAGPAGNGGGGIPGQGNGGGYGGPGNSGGGGGGAGGAGGSGIVVIRYTI